MGQLGFDADVRDWGGWYDHVRPPRSMHSVSVSACLHCS